MVQGILTRRATGSAAPSGTRRLALSALRAKLDDGSAAGRWLIDPDGVWGRVLELGSGAAYTVPLALSDPVSLAARAMLLPHDWRDLRGAVRTVIAACDADGRRRVLWTATLRAGDRGRPSGVEVRAELPVTTTALRLEVHPLRRPPEGGVARAIWVEPTLLDPAAPAPAAAATPAAPVASRGDAQPLFSVLIPVHDPPPGMLEEAVASVQAQTFPGWELELTDDGSREPSVIAALAALAAGDPRIHLRRHPEARGISAATNTALAHARGRYVALLDHDDTLAPDALARVAAAIATDPALDMIYTDEDIVDSGRQVWVHLKPAWSPDTLRTNGYTCHLGVYRRALVQEIGGFRPQFDGSQDIDMILRLTERTDRVAHVPGILYHWRAHPTSTAGGDAKPYAYVAARGAYADHLRRTGTSGTVGYGPPGLYRLAAEVDAGAPVAIVLAMAGTDGLAAAARSWLAQDHGAWTLTLAAPPGAHAAITRELSGVGLDAERLTLLDASPGESAAATLARAAGRAAARAEYLLLSQAAAAGLTHGWLTRLLGYAAQPQIAAAGPIVLAADGRVAHGGVALPDGVPLHLLHGSRTSMDDHFGYGTSVHNVSAVSGTLLTPAATYLELDGLDPAFGELALIEYCLRATEAGGRIVTVPDARLRLTAADDSMNDLSATWALERRWSERHAGDPFYNPGYLTDRGDFARRAS